MDSKEKIRKIFLTIVNFIWMLLSFSGSISFRKSTSNIEAIQKKILFDILKKNKLSEFGTKHNFSSISDIVDFKSKIPIADYDSYISYIDSIYEGNSNILTSEPVLILEPTSGSTAPAKYIPYTKTLSNEFRKGISPWVFDLFTNRRELLTGTSYWSLTPINIKKEISKGGIPIGFENDSEYLGTLERYLMNFIFTVPREVSKIDNIAPFRYITLLFLLRDKQLSFISIWNPTFLTLLLEPTLRWSKSLISDIRNATITSPEDIDSDIKNKLLKMLSRDIKRAEELSIIFERWKKKGKIFFNGVSLYEEIWPNLVLISCWADGNSTCHIEELKTLFPNKEIQPKGLIATEGFISFPLIGHEGTALSLNSHFFEFIEIGNFKYENMNSIKEKDTKLAYQLEMDKLYSVVITTGGGLYRYKLNDIIKVVGFYKQCPLIRFVGKEDKVSDLFGEKLNEYHVLNVLRDAFEKHLFSPSFFMIAPEEDLKAKEYFYTLFLELENHIDKINFYLLVQDIEKGLRENPHYKYCRKLNQISELRVFVINSGNNAHEMYIKISQTSGQKLGNIKPSILHPKVGWSKIFPGSFIN